MTYLIIGGLLLAVLVVYFGARRNRAMPLLRADIGTHDGRRFQIALHVLHHEMAPVEYVRLILHFAAKTLYNLGATDQVAVAERAALLRLIGELAERGVGPDTDVRALVDSDLAIERTASVTSDKIVRATLGFVNPVIRAIHTSIPVRWFESQFVHSWLALIDVSLPKLDALMIERLNGSLKKLNELYTSEGIDPTTLAGLREAPNEAFNDAVI